VDPSEAGSSAEAGSSDETPSVWMGFANAVDSATGAKRICSAIRIATSFLNLFFISGFGRLLPAVTFRILLECFPVRLLLL